MLERDAEFTMGRLLQRLGAAVAPMRRQAWFGGAWARGRALASRAPLPPLALPAASAETFDADLRHRRTLEVLAFAAHELRGPLAPLRTAAGLLGRADAAQLAWAQGVIERQVVHMGRMIDDILDLARADRGVLRLHREAVQLGDILQVAAAACLPALARRGQQLDIRGLEGGHVLHADAVRLTQVFTNLLDNASKYSGAGTTIRVEVAPCLPFVDVAVEDDGIGIDPAVLPGVFEPFVQDPHAMRFEGSGLGIGLAVVRQLVTSHGGQVTAASGGLGRGSRFVVRMPAGLPGP